MVVGVAAFLAIALLLWALCFIADWTCFDIVFSMCEFCTDFPCPASVAFLSSSWPRQPTPAARASLPSYACWFRALARSLARSSACLLACLLARASSFGTFAYLLKALASVCPCLLGHSCRRCCLSRHCFFSKIMLHYWLGMF